MKKSLTILISFISGFIVATVIFTYCYRDIILLDQKTDEIVNVFNLEQLTWSSLKNGDLVNGEIYLLDLIKIQELESESAASQYDLFLSYAQLMLIYKNIGDNTKYDRAAMKAMRLLEIVLDKTALSENDVLEYISSIPKIVKISDVTY
jgi:hypothetical protein